MSYAGGQHHYPALPGVAAGIALGIKVAVDRVTSRWHWKRLRPILAATLLAIPVAAYVVEPQLRALRIPADQRWGRADRSLSLAYPVSRFLDAHTRPENKIFVAGSDSEVYWLSGRDASTRFFHAYPLRWNAHFHVERRANLLDSPPAAIVVMPGAAERERQFWTDVADVLRRRPYRRAYENDGARVWLLARGGVKRLQRARTS
jgi:hypothetical protein